MQIVTFNGGLLPGDSHSPPSGLQNITIATQLRISLMTLMTLVPDSSFT